MSAASINISDNVFAPTAYTETVQNQTWVGSPFQTSSAATLSGISLLLGNSAAGLAELDLYSGTLQPDTLIGSLVSPSAYSPGVSLTSFNGAGLTLNSTSTYWVLLRALSGKFEWAYTESVAGSGVGFTPGWGVTDNSGASWFTAQNEPMQMRVEALAVQPTPEPSTLALVMAGCCAWGLTRRRLRTKLSSIASGRIASGRCTQAALLLLSSTVIAAADSVPSPVSILAPIPGTTVRTASVPVSVKIDPAVNVTSLRANLNGQNISSYFFRTGHCRPDGCPYGATLTSLAGLRWGKNIIFVQTDSVAQQTGSWHMAFDWLPQDSVGATNTDLPPAVGFSTPNPGGGSSWVSLFSNRKAGSTTTYPTSTACTTAYQVLALSRTSLTFTSYTCYDDDAKLTTALKTFTADDLVIAGTSFGRSALSKLDTTPIGGTNYGATSFPADKFPISYMTVGVGGAPAGQAYENAGTSESGNDSDTWARANGLLAIDGSGHYNFHPSDFAEFQVRPQDSAYSTASMTISNATYSNATYTSPTGTNGFWLLILERRHLFSVPGCTGSSTTANLYPNCGAFYATGSSDSSTASKAMADLASSLKSAGQSKLIFLTAVGSPFVSAGAVSSDLANAVNSLGGSGYTLGRMKSGDSSTYTLVSSNDAGFEQPFTGSAIVSTNLGESGAGSNNGQTGYVKGVIGLDRNGLYRPLAASQETKDTIDDPLASADFSAYRLFWSQASAWPLMDTAGRVAAYQYLSYQVVRSALQGATGSHVDDIRYYYPGDQNYTVATSPLDPQTAAAGITYPSDKYCWPGPDDAKYATPVCFAKGDADDVAGQLQQERGFLKQSIAHFAGSGTGRGLRDALAGDSNSITASMFSAMATVQSSLAASSQYTVPISPSKWLKLSGTLISLGSAANPAFGVVGGLLNAAAQVTAVKTPSYSPSLIPNAFADYETTLADFTQATADYIKGIQSAFDTSLDNVYSDWSKLSGVGLKVSNTDLKAWYFADQTSLEPQQDNANKGAQQAFYLQLLPKSFNVDFWPADVESTPQQIGTYYMTSGKNPALLCDKFYELNPLPGWSWQAYKTPSNTTKTDIFVVAGAINKNESTDVTEQYPSEKLLSTLFDPNDTLKLQRDLFFGPNGPLVRRDGPSFSKRGRCYR